MFEKEGLDLVSGSRLPGVGNALLSFQVLPQEDCPAPLPLDTVHYAMNHVGIMRKLELHSAEGEIVEQQQT